MQIGDKVRMIHGREEGLITRLIDEQLIEVEIEDGFLIPVLRKEVVVIDKAEDAYFGEKPVKPEHSSQKSNLHKRARNTKIGLYLAYKPLNDRLYSVYLVNTTSDIILFSALEMQPSSFKPLASGSLPVNEAQKISQLNINEFESWPSLYLQAIAHPAVSASETPPRWQVKFKPKASQFYRNKQHTPVLESEAHLFKLELWGSSTTKANLSSGIGSEQALAPIQITPPPSEVDLHIDKLVNNHKGMKAGEILAFQLETFERQLENALAANSSEITFIHGLGNGTLKHELQKRLSQRTDIVYFKDAQKEKFGYGATLVRLK